MSMTRQNLDIYDKVFKVLCERMKAQINETSCPSRFMYFISHATFKPVIILDSPVLALALSKSTDYIKCYYKDMLAFKHLIHVSSSQLSRDESFDELFKCAKDHDIYFVGMDIPVIHAGESLESLAIEHDLKHVLT